MKAAVVTKYGSADNIEIKEVEDPRPKSKEVKIKILASTVTSGNVKMRSLNLALFLPFHDETNIWDQSPTANLYPVSS